MSKWFHELCHIAFRTLDAGQGRSAPSRAPTADRAADAAAQRSNVRREAIRWAEDGAANDALAEAEAVGALNPVGRCRFTLSDLFLKTLGTERLTLQYD